MISHIQTLKIGNKDFLSLETSQLGVFDISFSFNQAYSKFNNLFINKKVRLWIEMNRTDGAGNFNLMQTFPRKVYTEDDMMRSLTDLSLVPASSLVITK